jgi:hypothetical protein
VSVTGCLLTRRSPNLFTDVGRRSVPPSVVATVMVLQRLEALVGSGGGRAVLFRLSLAVRGRGRRLWHGAGWRSFAHTVLVDMRARLAASADPDRIFATVVEVAAKGRAEAGHRFHPVV